MAQLLSVRVASDRLGIDEAGLRHLAATGALTIFSGEDGERVTTEAVARCAGRLRRELSGPWPDLPGQLPLFSDWERAHGGLSAIARGDAVELAPGAEGQGRLFAEEEDGVEEARPSLGTPGGG